MADIEQSGNDPATTCTMVDSSDATVGLPAAAAEVQERVNLALHKGHSVCLVLDYGSQYTQLIARRIRENGVYSMLMAGDATLVTAEGSFCELNLLAMSSHVLELLAAR